MEDLEKVRQWLQTFPLWEDDLFIDYTGAVPGNTGVYPVGLEELSRQGDILGNVTARCRYRFSLYRVAHRQQDGTDNAGWLMTFQSWVQEQSALGLAPAFGDVPAGERLRAEKGRLQQAEQTGTGVYRVDLIADFVKKFTA